MYRFASFALLASTLVACAGTNAPTPTHEPIPAQEDAGTIAASSPDYDPAQTMFDIFSGLDHQPATTIAALERARDHNDVTQVPVIIEIMRFYGDATVASAYYSTLQELTGVDFLGEERPWNAAMEWHGQNRDRFQPPAGYSGWKVDLLSLIDPRMGSFLTKDSTPARVDLTEVVWGGVRTDGIPDLRNPPSVGAAEASFMLPNDRVFGVSINGEHRAYPLRILNAHEMANDWLGGEPIALAY